MALNFVLQRGRVVLEEKIEEKNEVTRRIEAGLAGERKRMKNEEKKKIAREEPMLVDQDKIEEVH